MVPDAPGRSTNAWEQTLAEMKDRATELSAAGWDVATVPAGHTTPLAPDPGPSDRFGYVHVVPGDDAEEFVGLVEEASISEYEIFKQQSGNTLFILTKLTDPEREIAAFVAGTVDVTRMDPMIEAVREHGVMYTHLQKLDETHVATVRHDDPDPLLPGGI